MKSSWMCKSPAGSHVCVCVDVCHQPVSTQSQQGWKWLWEKLNWSFSSHEICQIKGVFTPESPLVALLWSGPKCNASWWNTESKQSTELQRNALTCSAYSFHIFKTRIWTFGGFWFNDDLMTRCLQFCNTEEVLPAGCEGATTPTHTT